LRLDHAYNNGSKQKQNKTKANQRIKESKAKKLKNFSNGKYAQLYLKLKNFYMINLIYTHI